MSRSLEWQRNKPHTEDILCAIPPASRPQAPPRAQIILQSGGALKADSARSGTLPSYPSCHKNESLLTEKNKPPSREADLSMRGVTPGQPLVFSGTDVNGLNGANMLW